MEILAIDLGNKQVKLKSSKATYVVPSEMIDTVDLMGRDSFGKQVVKTFGVENINIYGSNLDPNSKKYVFGSGVQQLVSHAPSVSSLAFGVGRYKSLEFKQMLEFSIAKLVKDFEHDGPLEVEIVIGLPTEDYESDEIDAVLEDFLYSDDGKVFATEVDGKSVLSKVVDFHTLAQYHGSITTLNQSKQATNETVGLVDIGGGTILMDILKGGEAVNNEKNRKTLHEGVYNAIATIHSRANSAYIREEEVSALIKAGNKDDVYMWVSADNNDFTLDLTNNVRKVRREFTENTIKEINKNFKDLTQLKYIVFTGGGANFVYRDMINDYYGNKAVFLEEPETANVRGYYDILKSSLEE
jgi:plasmid segregation protein ParM